MGPSPSQRGEGAPNDDDIELAAEEARHQREEEALKRDERTIVLMNQQNTLCIAKEATVREQRLADERIANERAAEEAKLANERATLVRTQELLDSEQALLLSQNEIASKRARNDEWVKLSFLILAQ